MHTPREQNARDTTSGVHVESTGKHWGNQNSMIFYRSGNQKCPGAADYITENITIGLKATSPRATIGNKVRFDEDEKSHVVYKKNIPIQHIQDAAKI